MNIQELIILEPTQAVLKNTNVTLYPAGDEVSVVFNDGSKQSLIIKVNDLRQAFVRNELRVKEKTRSESSEGILSPKSLTQGARRSAYIADARRYKKHRNKTVLTESILRTARRIGDLNPPSWRTAYDWIRDAESIGLSSYENFPKKPRKRDKRIPQVIDDLIFKVLDDHLNNHPNPTKTAAYNRFKSYLENQENLRHLKVSRSTFFSRANTIFESQWIKKTLGPNEARKYSRGAFGKLRVNTPNELVQIDAIHPNILLKDDEDRVIGRPIIHMAIDIFSRSILGFSIEMEGGESSAGVLECLSHSLSRKPDSEFCKNDWPQHGRITELATDAGKAYMAETVQAFTSRFHITRQTTETRSPWSKGVIERFFRTLRTDFLNHLPGYVPRRENDKSNDAVYNQKAYLTVKEFSNHLTTYVVDDYHQRSHSALGHDTPYQIWMRGSERYAVMPVSDDDIRTACALLGERHTRTLDLNKGITVANVWYHSKKLQRLAEEIRCKNRTKQMVVEILSNPNDISKITVIDPDGSMFLVKAADSAIPPGMRRAELKAIKKEEQARKQKNEKGRQGFAERTREDFCEILKASENASARKKNAKQLSAIDTHNPKRIADGLKASSNAVDDLEQEYSSHTERYDDGYDSLLETDDREVQS